ncbi:hypothetical protein BaRGS_00018937 [Batillaria attramentaria]|uniref:Uncharacterized protein n=1 Tax=Batillaria attramentaria TaxID=370345 RepID=A0ABD0KRL3_9CAEN
MPGEKCFSYHCPHHATMRDCLQGTWQCDAGESISHCLTAHSHNAPDCDPSDHDKICTWCCEDEVCVRTLASGVYVVPDGYTTPPPPATTSPPPTTQQPLWTTTTTPPPPGKSS